MKKKYAAEKAEQRKNCSWEAETQGEKQTIHQTDLHLRVEELQKELKRLQENKAPQRQFQMRGSSNYREGKCRGRGRGQRGRGRGS